MYQTNRRALAFYWVQKHWSEIESFLKLNVIWIASKFFWLYVSYNIEERPELNMIRTFASFSQSIIFLFGTKQKTKYFPKPNILWIWEPNFVAKLWWATEERPYLNFIRTTCLLKRGVNFLISSKARTLNKASSESPQFVPNLRSNIKERHELNIIRIMYHVNCRALDFCSVQKQQSKISILWCAKARVT